MLGNLKIGPRLGLGFGVLLLLLCGITGFGSYQTARLDANVADLSDNWLASVKLLGDLRSIVNDVRRLSLRHVLETTEPDKQAQQASIDDLVNVRWPQTLAAYEKTIASAEERRLYEAITGAWAAHLEDEKKLIALSNAGEAHLAEARIAGTAGSAETFTRLAKAIDEDVAMNVAGADLAGKSAAATYRLALELNAIAGAVALAVGVTLAVLITRSITRPIQQAARLASAVAEGDLSTTIDVRGKDEIAHLLQALSRMNTSLSRIVGQVRSSSDSIATGSAQIATGNADLSQRTEAQASNLQQTAASMEEIASTVKSNADSALDANRLAASASEAASRGGEVVGQVVHTMKEIAASSSKIADIIGTIDGIAFQTNILALNAAVEAARAGEQGRGFAVVASEVRSLAGRAGDAAKEIRTLIGASVDKVETGARQVDAAGASMDEIVSQVRGVSEIIARISGATTEQSIGIGQVGEAVTQLDQVTQQNAALVEESAAAAESLKQQAARLSEVVSVFRTGAAETLGVAS